MDKQIEFMKEHLAHLTAKLDETATLQAQYEARQTQSEVRLSRVEEGFAMLIQLAKMTDSRLDDLTQNVETLTQNVGTLTQNVNALTDKFDSLTDKFDSLTDKFDSLTGKFDSLTGKVDSLTGKLDALTEKVAALTDAQRNTDERLNTLINVVERHISEGHNGKRQA